MNSILEKIDLRNLDKSNWKTFKFEKIAAKISETVLPDMAEVDIYIGLEHIDGEDIHIRRQGSPKDVKGGKLRCYPGDVIFGKRRAYQRKAAIVDFDGICSAHAFVFRANKDVIDPKLFPFFLHSDQFMHRMIDISVGGLSPTINWSDLKCEEFSLPPKEQQAKLAELLWTADDNILKQNSIIQKLKLNLLVMNKDLFKANTKTMKIKNLILKEKNQKAEEGIEPYIEIGDVNLFNKEIVIKTKVSVKGSIHAKKGSTLVSKVRPNREAITLLKSDQVISSGFSILNPDNQLVTNEYLFHCLAWNTRFSYLMSRLATGTTYPTISDDDVKNYKIPSLEISSQKVYTKKFNAVYRQMVDFADFLSKTRSLNKIILNQIF